MKKRILSFMISFILILTLIPVTALAKEGGSSATSPKGHHITASCDEHGSIRLEENGESVKIIVSVEDGYKVDYVSARTKVSEDEESQRISLDKDSANVYFLSYADVDEAGKDVSVYAGVKTDAPEDENTEETVEETTTDEQKEVVEVTESTESTEEIQEAVENEEVIDAENEEEVTESDVDETVTESEEDAEIADEEEVDPEEIDAEDEEMDLEVVDLDEELELAALDEDVEPVVALEGYEVAAGVSITSSNLSWVKDSGKTLSVSGSGKSGALKDVKIDGTVVNASNYTKSGINDTTVTFTAAYMNSLSTGVHTVALVYNSGETPAENLLIKQSPQSTITNVETNSTSNTTIDPLAVANPTSTNAPASNPTGINNVQTGDSSQVGVWIMLIIVAAFAIAYVPSAADKKLY